MTTEALVKSHGHKQFYTRLQSLISNPLYSRRPSTQSQVQSIHHLIVMSSKPHSQKVRGTLDNPKTKAAMKSDKPTPRLGDATSLKPENDDSIDLPENDSAPPAGQGNDTDSAPTVSEPYRNNPNTGGGDKRAKGNGRSTGKENLPHSKTVRGTLANKDGKEVNKTQLGDPVSLKAETSNTKMEKSAEREGLEKSKL